MGQDHQQCQRIYGRAYDRGHHAVRYRRSRLSLGVSFLADVFAADSAVSSGISAETVPFSDRGNSDEVREKSHLYCGIILL